MIIWGNRRDVIRLGDAGVHTCRICNQETQHSYRLIYQYFHFYFLFGAVHWKQYWLVCERCQNGFQIAKESLPREVQKPEVIPFLRRWGLVVLPLVGISAFAFLILAIRILHHVPDSMTR
jgi:hypothetical protein